MLSIKDLYNQVLIRGTICNMNPSEHLSYESFRQMVRFMNTNFNNEEIIIYSSQNLINDLVKMLSEYKQDYAYQRVNIEDSFLATRFIAELSFYAEGFTFHVIFKPDINGGIFVPVGKETTSMNCLIVNYAESA